MQSPDALTPNLALHVGMRGDRAVYTVCPRTENIIIRAGNLGAGVWNCNCNCGPPPRMHTNCLHRGERLCTIPSLTSSGRALPCASRGRSWSVPPLSPATIRARPHNAQPATIIIPSLRHGMMDQQPMRFDVHRLVEYIECLFFLDCQGVR